MRKLVCIKCKEIWYTCNAAETERCDICGGNLIEVDSEIVNEENTENKH